MKLLFQSYSLHQAFFGPFSFILHFITCAMHIKFEWPLMLLLGIVTLSGWDALDTVSSVSGQTSNSILSERKLENILCDNSLQFSSNHFYKPGPQFKIGSIVFL